MRLPRPNRRTVYTTFGIIAALALVFWIGRLSGGRSTPGGEHDATHKTETAAQPTVWTCSMHPQFKLPEPGKCPICFMDLIPLDSGAEDESGPRELTVSERAKALMEIETAPVERRFVSAEVRMVGKVDYDETRVSHITAWVPGRLERLFVDYTGIRVAKGDHMVELYSPELLSAQEELLQAIKAAKELANSDVSVVRETTEATIEAVREKLRLWGLTPEQIKAIEKRGTADDHMTIYAPTGGIVIQKNAQEGMYVKTGSRIYTIADLSQVWVSLDAYESDLQWVKYGQEVEFTTESYPGETFSGTISFIHPVLNEATRTVKVRVNVPNKDGRLKPGMFVRAVTEANVATAGRIMDAALAGKWISPMHPEIVKDEPGSCDVCGMPLVRAESLGYVGQEPTEDDKPLVIPATAPLLTGKRAVVYVELTDKDRPTYEGREVVLGPRAGGYYLVQDGLAEGERVITHGAFKIDAELQIQAKPSMMTPEGGGGGGAHAHHGAHATPPGQLGPQTHCPVMGGAINKDVYVDYKGKRIYFCCPGCEGSFMEKPEEYLEKMRAAGVRPEPLAGTAGEMKPQTHCPVMGGEVNKEVYVDYKGQRIYFCCPGCDGAFQKEPEKYLEKMRSEGIEPERVEVSHEH